MTGSGKSAATLTAHRDPGDGRRRDIGAAAVTIGRHAPQESSISPYPTSRRELPAGIKERSRCIVRKIPTLLAQVRPEIQHG